MSNLKEHTIGNVVQVYCKYMVLKKENIGTQRPEV